MKLEKDMAEEMSQFKANYQRQFQDKDFELHRRVLHVEEDENRVKMQQDRLSDAEKRNKVILDEIEAQRKELDSLRRDNNKYTKETLEQKEQIRTLNENLKREADVSKNRESEARVYGQENRTLKKLLDDTKEDYGAHREDQQRLIKNLRLQLDETKDMIDRLRETKDRELKRMRDRMDDERRKETEKYQFEYDKLREEIQLFARKLGQEENLNKQLSMLNYKLQNNLTDMGRDLGGGREDLFGHEAKGPSFYPSALNIDDDTTDQFKTRKKAWEELEREQEESKNNIKNLMRNAKADQGKPYGFNDNVVYNVPQDLITEKRQSDQFNAFKEEPRA